MKLSAAHWTSLWLTIFVASPGLVSADEIAWAWAGAVTSHSALVKAKLGAPGDEARLALVSEADAAHPRGYPENGSVHASSDGIVSFALESLEPDTRYHYHVEAEGTALSGTFHTFAEGPMDFRMAFASCADTGSASPVFDSIRRLRPELFLHTGDFHYEDIEDDDPALFLETYDRVLRSTTQGPLYRQVPIAYVWDDHDFGGNNSHGQSPSAPAALAAYRAAVPHYPLGTPTAGTINQAFSIGRVRVIVTDPRAGREPARWIGGRDNSMLGQAQLVWLEHTLATAKDAPLVVVVTGVPWITNRRFEPPAGWRKYARERERIANHIHRLGLTDRVVLLSGDAHMVAMDDGRNNRYVTLPDAPERGFPVVHAAPLDRQTSRKGGPYSLGVSRERGQFGLLEVEDDGHVLTAGITGRDIDGEVIPGMRLLMTCREEGCTVRVP